jgi:hypothetical protein
VKDFFIVSDVNGNLDALHDSIKSKHAIQFILLIPSLLLSSLIRW